MKRPTRSSEATVDRRRTAPKQKGTRRPTLGREEIDAAADAEEASTGQDAGTHAVHRRLEKRGSLSTVIRALKARRQEREERNALAAIVGGAEDDVTPGGPDTATGPAGRRGAHATDPGTGAGSAKGGEGAAFQISVLRRALHEQGKALRALTERVVLLEIGRAHPAGDRAPAAGAPADRSGQVSGDGVDPQDTSRSTRQRPPGLTGEEADRLLVALIRVIKANDGSARKHDLFERLPKQWQDKLDKQQVYEFARVRGRRRVTLRFDEGVFTCGPGAESHLRSMEEGGSLSDSGELKRRRKAASRIYTARAIEHLNKNPGKKFSDRELFDIVTKQFGKVRVSHMIMDVEALYRSLYGRYDRESKKVDVGVELPKGRTLDFVGDRSFTKA